jgi:dihydropteroate synthase
MWRPEAKSPERTEPVRLPGGALLDFSRGPLVMGILNATPDSFYGGSRAGDLGHALEASRAMIEAGADILDIGGESSRPGAEYVDARVEIDRVLPIVRAIRRESNIPISIDTRKAEVAEAALDAGASIVNDISALTDDQRLASVAVRAGAPVVLMHMRGNPKTMQTSPHYDDTVREVRSELGDRIALAVRLGLPREQIIIDPGIGFGKRPEDNLRLIAGLSELRDLGRPILVGLSRKSFLGKIVGDKPAEERLTASIAANLYAACAGADIVRVHDVRETVEALRVYRAIRDVG